MNSITHKKVLIHRLDMNSLDRSDDAEDTFLQDGNIIIGEQPHANYPYYLRIGKIKIYFEQMDIYENMILLFIENNCITTLRSQSHINRIHKLLVYTMR